MLRNVLTLILLYGCGANALIAQGAIDFPAPWQGEWTGDLVISNGEGELQRLPMILRILPQEDSTYSFALVYGEDLPENTRPYSLRTVDSAKGHYEIDEHNTIFLDDFLINGKLYSRFEVMGNLLLTTLEMQGDHLIYEIISGPLEPLRTTGDSTLEGEDIPPVNSYSIRVQQRAVLSKKRP